ncbi:hypothetical protein BT69DRAFT_419946 [Atractiella rhizophila]|nr:hypothetical protein BT69DRAFT_419946 [Atractiella rhizophila]
MGVYESREFQELKPRFRAMVQHLEPCWSAVVRKLEEHFPEQTESMRDLWDNVPGTVEGLGLSGIFTGVVLNYGVSTWLHVDKQDHKLCVVIPFHGGEQLGGWEGGDLLLPEQCLRLELLAGHR